MDTPRCRGHGLMNTAAKNRTLITGSHVVLEVLQQHVTKGTAFIVQLGLLEGRAALEAPHQLSRQTLLQDASHAIHYSRLMDC